MNPVSLRGLGVGAGLVALLASAPAARQAPPRPAPPRPAPPQFRTGVELVEVDVSVLDAKRLPVRGLAAADFTVLENGQPQEILSFSAIEVAPAEPAPSGWMRDVSGDVRNNLAAADRLIVIVLDDAQVRWGPRGTQAVKEMARRVVDRLGRNDLAAIVFTRDNDGAQPFTNDRRRLLAAIDSFHGGFTTASTGSPADRVAADYFFKGSLLTLRYVAQSLYDAAQRRKAIFYLSPGVPLGSSELRQETTRLVEDARRANVNIYGLDPSGLGGLEGEDGIDSIGRTQSAANDLLFSLAAGTGGRALVNRNEFVTGVDDVFAENSSYYLVGYRSTNAGTRAGFRRIDVRVNRPGVTVRARSGYDAGRAKADERSGQSAALVKAMRDAAPRGDIAMQMTAAPFAVPDKKVATVAIAIALRQPRMDLGGTAVDQLQLMIAAYEPDGKRGASERLNARVTLKNATDSKDPFVHFEVLTGLQMAPGRYQLRVAAESALYGKEGSLHYDLEVPDFSKGDLRLSGVLLSAEPNVLAAGRERLGAVVPVMPTSRREFWPGDRVVAFVRVYRKLESIDPVTIKLRVLDAQERTVFERTDSAAANRLGSMRTADYSAVLPMDRLADGHYLVTLEASTARESVRRDVRLVRR